MESFKKVVADEDRPESTNRVGSHYRMQDIRSHTETNNFVRAYLVNFSLYPCLSKILLLCTFRLTLIACHGYSLLSSTSLDRILWCGFLAVQDSSIGDLVTHSVSESVMFCFSDFREHCRAVIDTCGFSDRETFERLQ